MRVLSLLLLGALLTACVVPTTTPPITVSPPVTGSPTTPGAGSATPPPASPTPRVPLTLLSPQDDAVVNVPEVEVRGTTLPEAVITLNDEIAVADENGAFSARVPLNDGPNEIIIVVSDLDGNLTQLDLDVTFDPNA